MNLWQAAQQIKALLLARKWGGDASSEVVFASGSVIISTQPVDEFIGLSYRYPMAVVRPGAQTLDPEFPTIALSSDLSIEVAQKVSSSRFAESAIIGGPVPDITKSQGKGILAIIGEVLAVVEKVDSSSGIRVVGRSPSASRVIGTGQDMFVAQSVDMAIRCQTQPSYPPGRRLNETSPNVLTWTPPIGAAGRYDFVGYVLRYNTGVNNYPTSPTDGTEAVLANPLDTSYTWTGAPGVYSFSLFAAYDTTGNGVADTYSVAEEDGSTFS